MKEIIDEINKIVEKYKVNGIKRLDNGTFLVCHAKHIAPQAWTHSIYAPLNKTELKNLEDKLDIAIPNDYKQFLLVYNGLYLFNGALSLDGLRKNYKRDIENIHQPFDLDIPNYYERLKDATQDMFFIGGYNKDGSLIYIDSKTNKVFRCSRSSITPLNSWTNFEEMLVSEILRLSKLFDLEGKKINSSVPTTP